MQKDQKRLKSGLNLTNPPDHIPLRELSHVLGHELVPLSELDAMHLVKPASLSKSTQPCIIIIVHVFVQYINLELKAVSCVDTKKRKLNN